MIRTFQMEDIDNIMKIWLETNIEAHDFIPPSYWVNNYNMVKEMLPRASIYVYEMDKQIVGFIGMVDTYIEGIFVAKKYQSQGIGRQLISYAKESHASLTLQVYQKNTSSVSFYKKENFKIMEEKMDAQTKEKELLMTWSR